jgi:hypothetical protein
MGNVWAMKVLRHTCHVYGYVWVHRAHGCACSSVLGQGVQGYIRKWPLLPIG